MNDELMNAARELMEKYKVDGLAIAVARGNEPTEYLFMGADAEGHAVERDSLFPVASITKLATALTVLRLVDANAIALDDALAKYLPHAASARDGVTIRTLLCHISGLPEDIPPDDAPYTEELTWQKFAGACLRAPLERAPHTRVTYSNVAYALLAVIVERVTRENFSDALTKRVLEPLGIEAYLGAEPPRAPMALADIRSEHAGTPLEPFNSRFWRSLAFPFGGLVTNAEGALALVRAFQNIPENFLRRKTRGEAISDQTEGLGGGYGGPFVYAHCPWGLGPDLRGEKKPHWTPPNASAQCFGHAGASGCVAWCEPTKNSAWAILGTRTADNGWLLRGTPQLGEIFLQTD